MGPLPSRPARPIPATLQEKYFIEAVDMLWFVIEELRGVREELQAMRNEKPTAINNSASISSGRSRTDSPAPRVKHS